MKKCVISYRCDGKWISGEWCVILGEVNADEEADKIKQLIEQGVTSIIFTIKRIEWKE